METGVETYQSRIEIQRRLARKGLEREHAINERNALCSGPDTLSAARAVAAYEPQTQYHGGKK